jgi:hypothetical protein
MRITTIIVLFGVLLAGTAFAGDNGNGCKLQGTWLWEMSYPLPGFPDFMLKFWATYIGTGDNEGAEIVEWINLPGSPDISYSTARGVWKKSGPNEYDYTMIGFGTDVETGTVFLVQRSSGKKTLTGCNKMEATSVFEFLDPDTMEPMGPPVDGGSATATRVLLQKPDQP